MLDVPIVQDFKEIPIGQKDINMRNIEIEVQLRVADGTLQKLTNILFVSRHQQLLTAQPQLSRLYHGLVYNSIQYDTKLY